MANSLMRAIFAKLNLPKWLNITALETPVVKLDTSDISATRVLGADVSKYRGCAGLPAHASTYYLLFRYARPITITVAGVSITITAKSAQDMCLLLDICGKGCSGQDGVAFLFALPESVLSSFAALPAMAQLASQGVTVRSLRFGLGGLLDAFPGRPPVFWNGFNNFVYSGPTDYNLYFGGSMALASAS